jgi:hypothetical protein
MHKLCGVFVVLGLLAALPAAAGENTNTEKLDPGDRLLMEGEVFYSEPLQFDYDKDGVTDTVVMGATLFAKVTADGTGEGSIERYLYDVKLKKPVTWYMKQNMLSEPPIGIDKTIRNLSWQGRTVQFDSGGWHYTVTDGGKGYQKDTIMVSDANIEKKVKLFGGDVTIYEIE